MEQMVREYDRWRAVHQRGLAGPAVQANACRAVWLHVCGLRGCGSGALPQVLHCEQQPPASAMASDWEDKLFDLQELTLQEKFQLRTLLADKQEHARLAHVTGNPLYVVPSLRLMLAGMAGGSSMGACSRQALRVVGGGAHGGMLHLSDGVHYIACHILYVFTVVSDASAWPWLLHGGARGWVQAACAGEAHMCPTHARRDTGMHALEPDVTAPHVCLAKRMWWGGRVHGVHGGMLHGCSMVR